MNYFLYRSLFFWIVLSGCSSNQSSSNDTEQWTKDSTVHFVLTAQKGVRSEKELHRIGVQLEQIQKDLLRLLHERAPQRLQFYFLKDRETLTSYTGYPAKGFTDTQKGIIYFVDKAPFHLALKHETMHALSWRLWGTPHGYWLSEGIAVFASGNCGGYSLHELANAIERKGKFVSFDKLTDTFDFKSVEPSLQAASLVQFIYDTYGAEKLKSIWKAGLKNTQKVLNITPDDLQKKWMAHIKQPQFEKVIDWNAIRKSGCE